MQTHTKEKEKTERKKERKKERKTVSYNEKDAGYQIQ